MLGHSWLGDIFLCRSCLVPQSHHFSSVLGQLLPPAGLSQTCQRFGSPEPAPHFHPLLALCQRAAVLLGSGWPGWGCSRWRLCSAAHPSSWRRPSVTLVPHVCPCRQLGMSQKLKGKLPEMIPVYFLALMISREGF